VSAVGIGDDAQLLELDMLAKTSGGTRLFLPGPENTQQLLSLTLDLGDLWTGTHGSAIGRERVASARTRGGLDPPTEVLVEPGAAELYVTVLSARSEAALATLRSPSGTLVDAVAGDEGGHNTTYRVAAPEPGAWTVATLPLPDDGPSVFIEGSVDAPARLIVSIDAADAVPFPQDFTPTGPDTLASWQGSDLVIRAAVWENGTVPGCQMRAHVLAAGGSVVQELVLFDDGLHHDEDQNDGVYARVFARTGRAGPYSVRVTAECTSALTGAPLRREKLEAALLRPLPDLDADGVPDAWEDFYGLPAVFGVDADADGLADADEFLNGTNPRLSDSDGGGEADGAEVAAGRDPREPTDDSVAAPVLVPVPGNGVVYLPAALGAGSAALVVQRAPSVAGPFAEVARVSGSSYSVDPSAQNDVLACYRMRVEGSTHSGWSLPACVTPRVDPFAPRVTIERAPKRVHDRDVEIDVSFDDPTGPGDGFMLPVDLGVIASGVPEMRVWFGGGPPDGVQWQAAATHLDLRLPDTDTSLVQIQARDAAGNVGDPATVIVRRPRLSDLDRAIALEQHAEDQIEAGDLASARADIDASLPLIKQQLAAAAERAAKESGPSSDAHHAVVELAQLLGLKSLARALTKPQTLAHASAALAEALAREIALAEWADQKGLEL
jgi:hypothetical protein